MPEVVHAYSFKGNLTDTFKNQITIKKLTCRKEAEY